MWEIHVPALRNELGFPVCLAKSRGVSPLASCASMSAPCLMRQLRHCKWAPDAAKWAGVAPESKKKTIQSFTCVSRKNN